MLDDGRRCKKRPHNRAPLRKRRRLSEPHRVVFQSAPKNLKRIPLGALNAAVDLVALKSLGMLDDGAQATLDGLFKSGILTGLDANIGKFENHESTPGGRETAGGTPWHGAV